MILCALFLREFCSPKYISSHPPKGYNILHASILFKHGLRAPIDKIPGHEAIWNCTGDNWLFPGGHALNEDVMFLHQFKINPIPKQSFLKGNCRAGELIDEGIRQIKEISLQISKNYPSLLPESFSKRHFNFRSTYTNRCLASIQILMHYLYPGSDPIDVFVSNEELETLIPNPYICPELSTVMQSIIADNTTFGKTLADFSAKLQQHMATKNITAIPHWMRLGELLSTHHCAELGLPGGFEDDILDESLKILSDFYDRIIKDVNGRKYAIGLLLSDLYLGMRDHISGVSDSKINIFCGHSLSIMSLLNFFNVSSGFPSFGSYISFELLSKLDQHFVRLTYNGEQLSIMSFEDFQYMVLSNRPKERECKIQYPYIEKDKKNPGTKFLQMSFS